MYICYCDVYVEKLSQLYYTILFPAASVNVSLGVMYIAFHITLLVPFALTG